MLRVYWLMFIISLQSFFNPYLVPRLVSPARVFSNPHLSLGKPVEGAALIPRFFFSSGTRDDSQGLLGYSCLSPCYGDGGTARWGDWVYEQNSRWLGGTCQFLWKSVYFKLWVYQLLVRYIVKYSCRPTLRDASWKTSHMYYKLSFNKSPDTLAAV